jgi:hypothetical protein
MQKYFEEKVKILNDEARNIHKNMSNRNLFIRIDNYDSDESEEE